MAVDKTLYIETYDKLLKLAKNNIPVTVAGINYFGLPFSFSVLLVNEKDAPFFDEDGLLCHFDDKSVNSDLYFSHELEESGFTLLKIKDENNKTIYTNPETKKLKKIANANFVKREFFSATPNSKVLEKKDRATDAQVELLQNNIAKYVNAEIKGERIKATVIDVWVDKYTKRTEVMIGYKNMFFKVLFSKTDKITPINNMNFLENSRLECLN